jgi:hypothetical protein
MNEGSALTFVASLANVFKLNLPDHRRILSAFLQLELNPYILRADMAPGPNTSSADTNRPRTRQRRHKPPPPIDVPDIDQDAAERKRLLNVLAQRRYRGCILKDNPHTHTHITQDSANGNPGLRRRTTAAVRVVRVLRLTSSSRPTASLKRAAMSRHWMSPAMTLSIPSCRWIWLERWTPNG